MLSNIDIERLAGKLDLPIVGVFSKDQLPKERYIGSYYINLQNHDDGDGTHWCFFKIFEDRGDNDGDTPLGAIYFDSFGVGPPKEVEEFLKPFKPIPYNNRQIQDIDGEVCGWYCIYCDYYLEQMPVTKSLPTDYNNFLSIWSDDKKKNTKLLKEYFKPL